MMVLLLLAAKALNTRVVVLWASVLIVAVVALGVVLLLLRGRLLGRDSAAESEAGLMRDLRAMRDDGRITPEEYDAARKRMATRMAGPLAGKPGKSAPATLPPTERTVPAPERRARPGYDLTGAPLPRPDDPTPPEQ